MRSNLFLIHFLKNSNNFECLVRLVWWKENGEKKLQKLMIELGQTLVQIHLLISIIFCLFIFFPSNKRDSWMNPNPYHMISPRVNTNFWNSCNTGNNPPKCFDNYCELFHHLKYLINGGSMSLETINVKEDNLSLSKKISTCHGQSLVIIVPILYTSATLPSSPFHLFCFVLVILYSKVSNKS
jgi:hypothetical protein